MRRITGRTPTAIWGPATKFVRGHPRWAKPRDQTPEIDRLGVSPMEKYRSFVSARRRRGGIRPSLQLMKTVFEQLHDHRRRLFRIGPFRDQRHLGAAGGAERQQ